jgi:hypothetical protein
LKSHTDTGQLRNFGLIVGGIISLLFGAAKPWIRHGSIPLWPWITGAVLVGSAVAAPAVLRYPFMIWDRTGKLLGWINSRIVLHLLFFLIFVPAGLIARLFGWDPLRRSLEPSSPSYRIPSIQSDHKDMEKPY